MAKKKRDIMVNAYGARVDPSPSDVLDTTGGGIILTAAETLVKGTPKTHMLVFNPMRRILVPSNAAYVSSRTASDCYIVGLSERFEIIPSDSSMWFWRRVIVSWKDVFGLLTVEVQTGADNQGGISRRPLVDLARTSANQDYNAAYDEVIDKLFQGVYSTDWNNTLTAKIDNRRFTVHSDRRRTIKSGNAASAPRTVKTYQKFGKMMYFDDEENGTSVTPAYKSVTDKRGMGNIFVFDFFQCPAPLVATSNITVGVNSTMYWHEK